MSTILYIPDTCRFHRRVQSRELVTQVGALRMVWKRLRGGQPTVRANPFEGLSGPLSACHCGLRRHRCSRAWYVREAAALKRRPEPLARSTADTVVSGHCRISTAAAIQSFRLVKE
ncbi:hypothetical protein ACFX2C_028284 [Malus domestica]